MGIEPTSSAWKAEVLPLNYTRGTCNRIEPFEDSPLTRTSEIWWRGEDSNLRRLSRQIYSLFPLTTREPLQSVSRVFWLRRTRVSTASPFQ